MSLNFITVSSSSASFLSPPANAGSGTVVIDATKGSAVKDTFEATGDSYRVLTQKQFATLDAVRAKIAYRLVWTFIGILVLGGIVASLSTTISIGSLISIQVANWDHTKEYLNVALPAVTGLLGSTIGFYFGSRSGNTGPP